MNQPKTKLIEVSPLSEPFFYLFLFYVVVWYTQLTERWADMTGGLRIEAIVSAVLLLVVLLGVGKEYKRRAGIAPYVIAYFVVVLIQVWNSWNTQISWFFFSERVVKYAAMGLFIAYFVRSPAKLRLFMFFWLLACFKIVQEGVYGGITGFLVWENQGIPRLHGSTVFYKHPNSLSQLALGTLPFIYFLYPVIQRIWLRMSLLLLLGCSLYCIIYTGSRTGYLGVLAMIGLIWWQLNSKGRIRMLLAAILLIPLVLTFMPEEYKGRFKSTFVGQAAEGRSKEGRVKMYGEGWYIFTKHPFGVGAGNYPLANKYYFNYSQEVHCLYLEVLTHLGIHGFIVFLLLLLKAWLVLKKSLTKLASSTNVYSSHDREFMIAVGKATLVYLGIRLFVDIFSMDLYGICWWFVIGIGSALYFLATASAEGATEASSELNGGNP